MLCAEAPKNPPYPWNPHINPSPDVHHVTVLIFFDGDQVTVQNRHMMDITCAIGLCYSTGYSSDSGH